MSDFNFLNKYVFDSPKAIDHESTKHTLIKLKEVGFSNIKKIIDIPAELNEFWKQIGYGFFHNKNKYSFDRLLDPNSFKIINLREEYYEFDPDLEYYCRLPLFRTLLNSTNNYY